MFETEFTVAFCLIQTEGKQASCGLPAYCQPSCSVVRIHRCALLPWSIHPSAHPRFNGHHVHPPTVQRSSCQVVRLLCPAFHVSVNLRLRDREVGLLLRSAGECVIQHKAT
uniref:Uncharacterized protein n=1 Tax=Grammatophora oceanica TaxID=210454 RepID=A0A7S1UMQ6_9STRA